MAVKKSAQFYIDLEDKYGAKNYKPLDVVVEKADGVWLYDVEGKKYLDCLSAYSAVNQGHKHPKILQAMLEQANKVTLTSRAFRNDKLPLFYEKICTITGYQKVLPMNSGAEAVETAIKAARKWGYTLKKVPENKAEIIVCSENFHGRTTTIISFTTDEDSKKCFGPYTDGFVVVKYGDIEEIKNAVNPNTIAVMLEPIQGEAGIKIPPKGYLKDIRQICDENNILMILDEIQTGFGRTGKMFAFEHENIRPDMVTVGKALSGGFYPVSAVLANKEILGVFNPGEHGSTFGGNPLACAIAISALDVIIDEKLCEKSAESGAYLMEQLNKINSPKIKEIRGIGLFVGIELNEKARPFCELLFKKYGILVKETHENTIRVAPPLVIQKTEIDYLVECMKKVFV
ncbi:MAG: ornithine--oxo-acid transaminase [Candidatus Gastranaerophilales bacterium]|nr:ornithine--oxo-acid transaminase [Candidatus Gastranaerophilales bacterium]